MNFIKCYKLLYSILSLGVLIFLSTNLFGGVRMLIIDENEFDSKYVFIYQLNTEQTENWVTHKNKLKWLPALGTKVDSFLIDGKSNVNKHPPGNYLLVWVIESTVHYRLASSSNYFITTSKIEGQGMLQLFEIKTKKPHEAVKVYLNKKIVEFDEATMAYVLNKKKGLLKIVFKEYTLFTKVDEAKFTKKTKIKNNYKESFVVYNKPKYKSGDTLKMKAVLIKKSGKFYRDSVLIQIKSSNRNNSGLELIVSYFTRLPDAEGGIHLSFPITDTMRFDESYSVNFYEGNISPKQKKYLIKKPWKVRVNRLAYSQFYLEDYVLDEAVFNVDCAAEFFNNQDAVIKINAFDQNNLPIKDGKVKITCTLAGIRKIKENVIIPYAFEPIEVELDLDGTTEYTFKKKQFPKAKLYFKIEAEFTNSNNEYQTSSCYFRYDGLNAFLDIAQVGKQFKVSTKEEQAVNVYFSNDGELLDSVITTSNQLIPYNPMAKQYYVETEGHGVFKTIPLANINGMVKKFGDTITLSVVNPFDLYFSYTIFKGGKILSKGTDKILNKRYFDQSDELFELEITYLWRSQMNVKTYQCFEEDRKLFVQVNHKEKINPGETIPISLQVRDSKNNPVQGVNITAAAINKQFKKPIHKGPVYRHESKNGKFEKSMLFIDYIPTGISHEINTLLKHELNLNNRYYNTLMPEDKFIRVSTKIAPDNCQFWLYMMKNKRQVPINYILVDDTLPVYFSGMNDIIMSRTSACLVPEGIHDITVVTANRIIQFPQLKFELNTKLTIAFSDSLIDTFSALSYTKRAKSLTAKEKNMYNNHVAEFKFREHYRYSKKPRKRYGYVLKEGRTFHVSPHRKNNNFVGPINKGEKITLAKRNYFYELTFTPGLTYTAIDSVGKEFITTEKSKQKFTKIIKYPKKKYFKKGGIWLDFKVVNAKSLEDILGTDNNYTRNDVPSLTDKGNGTLLIIYRGKKKFEIAHLSVTNYIGIGSKGVAEIHQITPGTYQLYFYDGVQTYRYKKAIKIKKNNLSVVLTDDAEIELVEDYESNIYGKRYRSEYNSKREERYGVSTYNLRMDEYNVDFKYRDSPYRHSLSSDVAPLFTINNELAYNWEDYRYRRRRPTLYRKRSRFYAKSSFGKRNASVAAYGDVSFNSSSYYAQPSVYYYENDRNALHSVRFLEDVSTYVIRGNISQGVNLEYKTEVNGDSITLNVGKLIPISLRTDFNDEGFWQPKLRTDENGEVKFIVQFPENITSWKTHFFALNEHHQYGDLVTNIKAYKQLVATLSLPRFLINGDMALVIAKTINYDDKSLAVTTTFNTGLIETVNDETLDEIIVTSYPVIAKPTDSLTISYAVQSSTASDGEERTIPIFPTGMEYATGEFHYLDEAEEITLTPEFAQNDYELYASAAGIDILLEKLKKLQKYKHTCNEQTASKLSALLAVKQIKQKMGKVFTKDLKVRLMIQKLKSGRYEKGLWGWWKSSDKRSLTVSIYVMSVLAEAKEMGYAVNYLNDDIVQLHLLYGSMDPREQLSALALFKQIDLENVNYDQDIKNIQHRLKNKGDDGALIDIALLQQKIGLTPDYDFLLRRKKETVLGGYYWGEHAYNWFNNSAYASIRALELFNQKGEEEKVLANIVNYFMEPGDHYKWRNTHETIRTIKGLIPYFIDEGQKKIKQPQITIQKKGKEVVITKFPIKRRYNNLSDTINITKAGEGSVYLNLYTRQWNPTPTVKEDIFVIQSKLYQHDTIVQKMTAGVPAKMVVNITVKKKANYVMLEIPIPAGCFYGEKIKENYYIESNREYRKRSTYIYLETLDKGSYTFNINLQPRFKGNYNLNPVKAELMYFPIFYGNNTIKQVVID